MTHNETAALAFVIGGVYIAALELRSYRRRTGPRRWDWRDRQLWRAILPGLGYLATAVVVFYTPLADDATAPPEPPRTLHIIAM